MKMKNCDLTLTTPALLKSLLVAYAGSLNHFWLHMLAPW